MAGAVVHLLAMPRELRESMGLRGRDWVLRHFNADTIAEQTMRAYAEAAAARRQK